MHGTLTIAYRFDLKGKALSDHDQEVIEQHVLDTVTPLLSDGEREGDLSVSLIANGLTTAYQGRWSLEPEHHLVSAYELLDRREYLADRLLENANFPGPVSNIGDWKDDDGVNHLYATVTLDQAGDATIPHRCTVHLRFADDTSMALTEAYVLDQSSGAEIAHFDIDGPEVAQAMSFLTRQ